LERNAREGAHRGSAHEDRRSDQARRSAQAARDGLDVRRRVHELDAAARAAARRAAEPGRIGRGGAGRVPAVRTNMTATRTPKETGMRTMTVLEALNDAMHVEMANDERVVVFGEDVGRKGGLFGTTAGLQEKFGEQRCFDTPLSECGIIGTAIGMAMYGLRPIAEIQFLDFIYPAFDQIVSEAAKIRYRSGGEYTCPLVI